MYDNFVYLFYHWKLYSNVKNPYLISIFFMSSFFAQGSVWGIDRQDHKAVLVKIYAI